MGVNTYTAQNVIQLAQEREPMDPIRAMQLLNEAHLYITTQLKLVPDVSETISLVSGIQEYALPDNVATIWDAAYLASSSNAFTPLKATNVDTLFEDQGGAWELRPSGVPWCYYERGGMIGFYPIPNTTSANGYPCVQIWYTQATTLTMGSTLPTLINSCYPWVYHMCRTASDLSGDPGRWKAWDDKFQNAMHYLREYVYGRMGRDRARVAARVKRVRRA